MTISDHFILHQVNRNFFEITHPLRSNKLLGVGNFYPVTSISRRHHSNHLQISIEDFMISGCIRFYSLDYDIRKSLKITPDDLGNFSTAKKVDLYFKELHKIIHHPPQVLRSIPHEFQTEEACALAIRKNPLYITKFHSNNLNPTLCLLAVEINPRSIFCVPRKFLTEEFILECLKKHPDIHKFIARDLFTPGICQAVLELNPANIISLPEEFLSPEMCLKAVKKNSFIFYLLAESLKTKEMELAVQLGEENPSNVFFFQNSEYLEWAIATLVRWYTEDPKGHQKMILNLADPQLINLVISEVLKKGKFPEEISKQIIKYRNSSFQLQLLDLCLENPLIKTEHFRRMIIEGTKPTSLLPLLLIFCLNPSHGELEHFKSFFNQHKAAIKDQATNLLKAILKFSFQVFSLALHPDAKVQILASTFLSGISQEEVKLRISLLQIKLKIHPQLAEILPRNISTDLLKEIFIRFFSNMNILDSNLRHFSENFFEKFIAKFRNPDAFFTYIAHFLHDPKVLAYIKFFISIVVSDQFETNRNLNSIHIRTLTPSQKVAWEKGSSKQFRVSSEPFLFDPKSFLACKISIYRHIDVLARSYDRIFSSPIKSEHFESELEFYLSELFHANQEDYLDCLNELKRVLRSIKSSELEPFVQDIEDQVKYIDRFNSSVKTLTLCDTSNYQDLFLCGTEILGSCLNIYGQPFYNKCLLGYLLDGKVRMLALKNQSGKIEARAMMKLLVDATLRPAILLEKLYPDDRFQEVFLSLAKEKAQLLGVPLHTVYKSGTPYLVESLGCYAPFEYEDSAFHGMNLTNGRYLAFTNLVAQ